MWDTSRVDWEERLLGGKSLLPDLPLFENEAAKAIRIFKRLRVVDVEGRPRMGDIAAEWVFDFVGAIFGCYDPVEKARMIQDFFLLIAKKNSKSTLAAGIMLTALIMNRRDFGEYLIIAPTKEIADNSFKPAYGMIKADPELDKLFKANQITRTVENRITHATLAVKAADADVVGGQKAIGVLIDELWLFGKKAGAENILSEVTGSMASRPEGFVICLSTQSDDPPAGVFRKRLDYHRAVRDGTIQDPRALQVIYELPERMQKSEAWKNPELFHLVNPNLGRSVNMTFLRSEYAKAVNGGIESLSLFAAKHLNVEIGIGLRKDRWPGTEHWLKRADETLTLQTLLARSEVVVIGIDGGGLDDLFGLAVLGRERGTGRWLLWLKGWCHEGVLARHVQIASVLRRFADDGDLVIVDDELQDLQQILSVVEMVLHSGLLGGVGVDPAGLGELVEELAALEITGDSGLLVGVTQGYGLMNAIKTTERKLANGTLVHSGSAMSAWCASNVKIEPTATAIRATKQNTGDKKIDPIMAAFNAVFLMARNPEPINPRSVYEDRGLLLV
jgi:phage terminase large subunit-like protein